MTYQPQQPRPKSGMPGWLIAIIIILVVIVLGCGGCLVTCTWGLKRGVEVGSKKAEELAKQFQEEVEKERKAQQARLRPLGTMPGPENLPEIPGLPTAPGGLQVQRGQLPSNFPADIPVHPDFNPVFSSSSTRGGTVLFTGAGTVADIADHYKKNLPAQGWTLSSETSIATATSQTYANKTMRMTVTIAPTPDNPNLTTVNITYLKK